jgi:DNA (cytosine-5)-methyltransferase 1
MITHYDLFAGIGGFSLALEEVFTDEPIRHIFCEWEQFPTSVLRHHWPDGEFWGDIADLVADTEYEGLAEWQQPRQSGTQAQDGTGVVSRATNPTTDASNSEKSRLERKRREEQADSSPTGHSQFTIVTGGFPCQPFSHAGRRKGTADDRYQWPNMFAVIRNVKPEWVIAENVRGLVTWNEGMVLETVCADLESEGYEVQPFIIPAVAVGAPHRRDRVWIIANRNGSQTDTERQELRGLSEQRRNAVDTREEAARQTNGANGDDEHERYSTPDADTRPQRRGEGSSQSVRPSRQEPERKNRQYPDWSRNWQEVAFATCDDSVDDGLSRLVDGVPISRPKWRQGSLKAYGNGIVAQVAIEIMKAIKGA